MHTQLVLLFLCVLGVAVASPIPVVPNCTDYVVFTGWTETQNCTGVNQTSYGVGYFDTPCNPGTNYLTDYTSFNVSWDARVLYVQWASYNGACIASVLRNNLSFPVNACIPIPKYPGLLYSQNGSAIYDRNTSTWVPTSPIVAAYGPEGWASVRVSLPYYYSADNNSVWNGAAWVPVNNVFGLPGGPGVTRASGAVVQMGSSIVYVFVALLFACQ